MKRILIISVVFWAGLISQALANHPAPDGEQTSEAPIATSEKRILKLTAKPEVEFTEEGFMKITVIKKKKQIFYAKLNGGPFPDGTETAVEESESAIGKTYKVLYKLPDSSEWAPVMLNMIGELTPYNKKASLRGDTLPGDPEGTEYKIIQGRLMKKLPDSTEWVPVEATSGKIEIYRLAVYDPRHPKKKIGDHFVVWNKETGDTVVIVGNFTDWARTIRRCVYVVAGGGTIAGVAWIIFLCLFLA